MSQPIEAPKPTIPSNHTHFRLDRYSEDALFNATTVCETGSKDYISLAKPQFCDFHNTPPPTSDNDCRELRRTSTASSLSSSCLRRCTSLQEFSFRSIVPESAHHDQEASTSCHGKLGKHNVQREWGSNPLSSILLRPCCTTDKVVSIQNPPSTRHTSHPPPPSPSSPPSSPSSSVIHLSVVTVTMAAFRELQALEISDGTNHDVMLNAGVEDDNNNNNDSDDGFFEEFHHFVHTPLQRDDANGLTNTQWAKQLRELSSSIVQPGSYTQRRFVSIWGTRFDEFRKDILEQK